MENDKTAPFIETNLYECHNQERWDSLKIINQLPGSWLWDSMLCQMYVKKMVGEDDYKPVSHSDFRLSVYVANTLEKEVKWTINRFDNNFSIQTEPFVEKVNGIIFFCNNRLVFYYSWLDGCDYYLKRIAN